MEKDKNCVECGLPVLEYKQLIQQCPDVCENCQLVALGDEEFPSEEQQ